MTKRTKPRQAASPASLDRWQREVAQLRMQAQLAKHWAARVEQRAAHLLASMQKAERR